MELFYTIFIVLLLILLAIVVAAQQVANPGGDSPASFSGAGEQPARGCGPRCAPAQARACNRVCNHQVGNALYSYAHNLDPSSNITGRRDGGQYTGGGSAKALKPWTEYESWAALAKDEGAVSDYNTQRLAVLNNPDLDWSLVLADMGPKLKENREHIGIVNLDADGRTLRLVASEASPVEASAEDSDSLSFASVPAALVAKYANRPGLFIFHTHPDDPRAWPLPSSQDLSAAIYFGVAGRFAASAVISSYGVIVYGPEDSVISKVFEAKDSKLAMLNLSHDVVAAHEATRSWAAHTINDYLNFYPRHRMLVIVYPSPKMVGDSRRYLLLWDLESPIDHGFIADHADDIANHLKNKKGTSAPRPLQQGADLYPASGVGFDSRTRELEYFPGDSRTSPATRELTPGD